jgi:hypothetical protein
MRDLRWRSCKDLTALVTGWGVVKKPELRAWCYAIF